MKRFTALLTAALTVLVLLAGCTTEEAPDTTTTPTATAAQTHEPAATPESVTDMDLTIGPHTGKYTGTVLNGKPEGYGVYEYTTDDDDDLVRTYTGDWKNGLRNGQGKLVYSDGEWYEGEWVDDKSHGQGKYVHSDGSWYEGEWANNEANGRGRTHYADGSEYVGEFADDAHHGQGKYVNSDGSWYDGEWADNKFNGQGTFHRADGAEYVGELADGVFHGRGKLVGSDGSWYDGEWVDGMITGLGTFHLPDVGEYVGAFTDGVFNGQGVFTDASGNVTSGTWEMGEYLSGSGGNDTPKAVTPSNPTTTPAPVAKPLTAADYDYTGTAMGGVLMRIQPPSANMATENTSIDVYCSVTTACGATVETWSVIHPTDFIDNQAKESAYAYCRTNCGCTNKKGYKSCSCGGSFVDITVTRTPKR
ncbi:MAG: hypothetical protein LBK23_07500 [Oscillospiraceae bacterium]|jgi:hypothetical protein|nr:hypothetical protein [Oscillospiraceae bacterium]